MEDMCYTKSPLDEGRYSLEATYGFSSKTNEDGTFSVYIDVDVLDTYSGEKRCALVNLPHCINLPTGLLKRGIRDETTKMFLNSLGIKYSGDNHD